MPRFAVYMTKVALLGIGLVFAAGTVFAEPVTLRVGLQDDPDVLDPHRARTYVGRIVFSALCDKLVDITPDLTFVPRLATSWSLSADKKALTFKLRSGVKFHDGEPFDAAAAKFNFDRALTLPDSYRRSELASIDSVEVVDPDTITLKLKRLDASLLAQVSDRAGMMISPKAASAGREFALSPVCSGPYKFAFDRIVYFPIPDTTV